jgi:predicted metal-dependent phosphoesterase TrpH
MDLVAITDHDSIDGALELASRLPDSRDVIFAEEVSCWFKGIEVHLGVYEMTESLHRDLQPLRSNALEVISCLQEAGVFFALNHLLHFYRGQAPLHDYLRLLEAVPAMEVRNGAMLPAHNLLIETIAQRGNSGSGRSPLGMTGGSDAHTLRRVGRTWTEAPGGNREEFLQSLRRGLGRPGGDHGGAATVAGDTYGVICSYVGSLAGFGVRDHAGVHRAACLAFTALSLPFQFLPMAIAINVKRAEARTVRDVEAQLDSLVAEDPGKRSLAAEELRYE